MKKAAIVLSLVMSLVIANVFAQDYKHPQINKKGEIIDGEGVTMGYVSKEGLVKDAKGQKLGFIDSNGNVTDANGKKLGKAAKNGNYYNEFGALEFTVKNSKNETCEMIGKNGQKVGTVHNDYKNQACAIHCFFDKGKMKEHKH